MGVVLIATGGTIASTRGADGLTSARLSGDDLLRRVPALAGRTDLHAIDVETINSWALSGPQMLGIARTALATLARPDVDGVIVTHGTDTLEETAFLTHLLLGDLTDAGGVVFTGAMRAADELGADGDRNLASSVLAAADPAIRGLGVLVCLDDLLHSARHVTKAASTGTGAFASTGGPLGRVSGADVVIDAPRTFRPTPVGDDIVPEVALLAAHPWLGREDVEAVLARGARGIVVQGTGAGNVPPAVADGLADALARDVPVVVTRRPPRGHAVTTYGAPGGGGTLSRMGAIVAEDLPAHKARVALMVALGVDPNLDAVRRWFDLL